ncbi:MAG TPA: aspartate aminotransferase family protein [Gammaproteobacteria bacterium]|jgi:acetylornithine/N-succinyldiaminopimelate aminotransferase|nr:aspartate aminotransferase family protein [Gammaproteobacteria bacterium]MDP6732501.1 aspartate aminotransferase family protein [Gammaproteobacteria bacterium]HAJ77076.1 aspartate aminotransferase family protein [Gammaproteobacteria bacterium]|tara:strand:- start:525 stop:1724 length:1200 start_codon:yes stop_codon:yes gene_type:complete
MNTIELEDRFGISFCNRQAIAVESGAGSYVWDEAGNKFLDFTSGWGVTCLGHCHPVITAAIFSQAQKIIQNPNSGFTYSPSRAKLLSTLQGLLPPQLVKLFFANSGAEANDAAIKLARKITGKVKIVSTLGSFHGRTFNTLSVSAGRDNTEKYLPCLPENEFVGFGDSVAMCRAVDSTTAAVIVEPVQGEGGVRIPEPGYLAQVAEICREHNALLIVDEIQTGFGRTGAFFALEHSDPPVEPDILTMGKGIAGGFPFAAFAVTEQINSRIQKGDHGGTYCGNPLGCAVAASVVTELKEQNLSRRSHRMGLELLGGLTGLQIKYPEILAGVRGKGLLCALQFTSDNYVDMLTQICLDSGLLITPTRNKIVRLIPSLLVSMDEIREALMILDESLVRVMGN